MLGPSSCSSSAVSSEPEAYSSSALRFLPFPCLASCAARQTVSQRLRCQYKCGHSAHSRPERQLRCYDCKIYWGIHLADKHKVFLPSTRGQQDGFWTLPAFVLNEFQRPFTALQWSICTVTLEKLLVLLVKDDVVAIAAGQQMLQRCSACLSFGLGAKLLDLLLYAVGAQAKVIIFVWAR